MKKKNQREPHAASVGDVIQFLFQDKYILGTVIVSRENSVIAQIEQETAKYLDIENERTVVSHKKYEIIKRVETEVV